MSALHEEARPVLAASVRLQTDPATGEPVLLFPEGITVLNETAREIVARCDGRRSVADIIRELAQEFDAPENEIRDDLLTCLRDLQQRKLIVCP